MILSPQLTHESANFWPVLAYCVVRTTYPCYRWQVSEHNVRPGTQGRLLRTFCAVFAHHKHCSPSYHPHRHVVLSRTVCFRRFSCPNWWRLWRSTESEVINRLGLHSHLNVNLYVQYEVLVCRFAPDRRFCFRGRRSHSLQNPCYYRLWAQELITSERSFTEFRLPLLVDQNLIRNLS
jgi:hypothetical protein